MDLAKEAFETVQAALLNSQCSPQEAVRQALRAVAQFAASENLVLERGDPDHDSQPDWLSLCEAAWKEYPELE